MPKVWRIHAHDADRIAALQRTAGIPAVVAQLLICRGTTDPDSARLFLEPKLSGLRDPSALPGCGEAAQRLFKAVAEGRRIVVYGDYDVDGLTASALLCRCLKLLRANVGQYVPNRLEEGYGLNCEAIRGLAAEGAKVLVTVDCGIASVAEAALAQQLGMEVIITDHHEPGSQLPQAAAIVHPRLGSHPAPAPSGGHLDGDGYRTIEPASGGAALASTASCFGGLSGAGVAFKLAWALCQEASGAKKVDTRMKDFLVQAVGLAALGTVADIVPLVDENRILVHHGLAGITQKPLCGVAALLEVAGLSDKRRLDSDDVAFALAPRLNAAGRLNQPQLALELLTTDRPDRALELARYIDQLNQSRQTLERGMLVAAGKQIKEQFSTADSAFVLADAGWHPGVIGIVAGRLAAKHHRPVILISFDSLGVRPGTGSARGVPGFCLYSALATCKDFLVSYGGHSAAAGLKIEKDKLDAFRAAFCEVAEAEIAQSQRVAELSIDGEAPLSGLTAEIVRQIEQLAPFGEGNARPLLCATGVQLAEPPKTMGSGGNHLALRLVQHGCTLRAVAFGASDWSEELAAIREPIDVAFRPVINSYRGRHSVELHLVDWRKSF